MCSVPFPTPDRKNFRVAQRCISVDFRPALRKVPIDIISSIESYRFEETCFSLGYISPPNFLRKNAFVSAKIVGLPFFFP